MTIISKPGLLGAALCLFIWTQAASAQDQTTPTTPGTSPTVPAPAPSTAPTPSAPAPAEHMHETAAPSQSITREPSRPGAELYIGWPQDGTVIHSTRFKIWFGLRNFGVAPAGVKYPNTGHHHLIIDSPLPPMDEPIPNDKNHLHFGLGQTEAVIELSPGPHTLQLLLGDENHIPHDPPLYSRKITVYVRP